MSTIFISYTSADKAWAEWIAWTAKEAGHTVHLHNWEIEGGGNIMLWMHERHKASDNILCVVSPNYLDPSKEYSAMEMFAAMWRDPLGKKGLLKLVVIDRCDLGGLLDMYKRVHLHDLPKESAKERLLDFLTPPKVPDKEPAFPGTATAIRAALPEPAFPAKTPILTTLIDTTNLPTTALKQLRGRDAELRRIDEAWDNPKTHVLSVVAWGGMGKTALVTEWVENLKLDGGRGADAILAYSFYSQGTKERATSSDRFLDWAVEKLGIASPGNSASAKAEAIAKALSARRVLLILDGLEPMQHGPGPQLGQLKDQPLRILLRRAAGRAPSASGGLVLVTSRLAVKDIATWHDKTAPVLDLKKLSPEAGAQLLRDRGVMGSEKTLQEATKDFDGHALALTLLAGFLVRRYGGKIERRDCIGPMVTTPGQSMDEEVHGHAKRVIASMNAEWLSGEPLYSAIMRIAGLFDRPASVDCINALRNTKGISGLDAFANASTDQIADAVFNLREAGLILAEDRDAPGAWDAHPLVREWFGEKFRSDDLAGWKAAHGCLYEHLRDTTKEGDDPTLADLESLFQAIPHGCKAGRHQEVLDAVYADRICRREADGQFVFHAQRRLGAMGASLAALAWFFDKPYEKPVDGLRATATSWVTSLASSFLGAMGRLAESLPGHRLSLAAAVGRNAWENASRSAGNLCEVELAIGDIKAAIASGGQAVDNADTSNDTFLMMVGRTLHANAQAMAGRSAEARSLFDDAETRQKKHWPEYPFLYSLRGAQFCDVLLNDGNYAQVVDRAGQALKVATRNNWVKDIGMDHCNLARAHLGLALTHADTSIAMRDGAVAGDHANHAIAELRRSGMVQFLPSGLLARARLHRATGDWEAARIDLDDVEEIAEPGPMRLYQCDAAIERCRLALAQIEGFAPLAAMPSAKPSAGEIATLKETALRQWTIARDLIAQCGYHKCDAERDELRDVLDGKRAFANLPPRV